MSDDEIPGAPRRRLGWVFGLVMVVLLGAIALALWRRSPAAEPGSGGTEDRIGRFVSESQRRLVAGELDAAAEQLHKASGLDERDPRVVEGLARIELVRAEMIWWRLLLAADEGADPDARLGELAPAVTKARAAVATARQHLANAGDGAAARLEVEAQRLEASWIYALALRGRAAQAKAEIAARPLAHPEAVLLAKLVARLGKDEPAAASGPASATAGGSAAPAASGPVVADRSRLGSQPGTGHFELDHEPVLTDPTTPGELQLPATKPKATDPPTDVGPLFGER